MRLSENPSMSITQNAGKTESGSEIATITIARKLPQQHHHDDGQSHAFKQSFEGAAPSVLVSLGIAPAAIIAIRSSCSWNNGTPSVRCSTDSSVACQAIDLLAPLPAGSGKDAPFSRRSDRGGSSPPAPRCRKSVPVSNTDRPDICARLSPGTYRWCRPFAAPRRQRLIIRRKITRSTSGHNWRHSSSTAIMPRPSRSTLMMPRYQRNPLYPLDNRPAAWWRLQRHHGIERAWQITMPPECCLRGDAAGPAPSGEAQIYSRAGASGRSRLRGTGARGHLPDLSIPCTARLRSFFQAGDFKPSALPTSRARRAAAVRDYIGLIATQRAEALVNVLYGLFAFVAAGQIDIDIRPFPALFAEGSARRAGPCPPGPPR